MKEESPSSFRTLTMTREMKIPFINITISQPRIRIKVPKLLAKTMQKRSQHHSHNNAEASNNKKKWAKPKKLVLPKKVGFIFSNVFGNKKSPENDRVRNNNNGDGFKEREILKNVENQHSLKKIFKLEDEDVKQKRVDRRENSHGSIMRDKNAPLKVSLSLSSFFNKKSKINKSNSRGDCSSGNGVDQTHYKSSVNGTVLESSDNSGYKVASTQVKMRRTKSMQKKATKQGEEESDEEKEETRGGDEELCKKRILMGEKCRPLNISGSLHYDKNGIFLPEVLP